MLLLCLSFLLMLFPCSSMGSIPQETVFCELLQHESFHTVQSFRNDLLQCRSPTGSQVLPENLLHCGLLCMCELLTRTCSSMGPPQDYNFLQGARTCSRVVPSTGYSVDICSTVILHGQENNLLCHGLHYRLQDSLL